MALLALCVSLLSTAYDRNYNNETDGSDAVADGKSNGDVANRDSNNERD